MIPLNLRVRNFMPYAGDVPPLSFEGIHTACICGDNGAGKSSLIDAITWALWGKARAGSDDDLIHQGQNEMQVEFDFLTGGQRYRIIRKRSRPKKPTGAGQSSLDLFVSDNGCFRVISGSILKETQAKITSLLNMDYDTFVNSAFLRQGHADEFTRQTPARRKEVLADILRLSIYDRLEERAKELSRGLQAEKTLLETSIAGIKQELEQKPLAESLLKKAIAELETLEAKIRDARDRLDTLRQQKLSMEGKKQQLARIEADIIRTKQEAERWHGLNEQRRQKIIEYQALIERRADIEEGYRQFNEARTSNDQLGQKLIRLNRLKEQQAPLERTIQKVQSKLLADHAVLLSRIAELETRSKKLPGLKAELIEVDARLARLAETEEKLAVERKAQQQQQNGVHGLASHIERIRQEITNVSEKLAMLETQKNTAACPLCETELTPGGLELIKTKYGAEIGDKSLKLAEAETCLVSQKASLEASGKELSTAEQVFNRERQSVERSATVLAQAIADAENAGIALEKEGGLLTGVEKSLNARDYAAREQEALAAIEAEIVTLGYDASLHEQAHEKMSVYKRFEAQKQGLEQADGLLAGEMEQLSSGQAAEDEAKRRLGANETEGQTLVASLSDLPRLESGLNQAETEFRSLDENLRKAQETVGILKGKLDSLSAQAEKETEKEKRLAQVAGDVVIYERLTSAFGKNGIQAMLIEMALPEIEADANDLLGRMTDNRMHIKIEAQRPKKTGEKMLETLDINISDELGTRPYDTYSGGETFRIDFAIRIALSRLLARRAGAPLRTLIIDEGFGTQDAAGMEKLKEAINSVKDSFEKILVITHVEEIKDAFPARINVTKTPSGSMIEVS